MKEKITVDKLYYEKECLAQGYRYIAGVDEVGRGPLAGPVVTAAVIMPLDDVIEGIDDSKKLSAKKREMLAEEIKKRAIAYRIERVEASVIDEINILQATRLCMKRSVENLGINAGINAGVNADMVLTDGNMTLDITIPQRSIIHGDALSYSIGAASILAKVYRDRLMDEYAEQYPQYAFEKNKGYGTAAHIAAIKECGSCPIHRKTFITKF